MGTKYIRILGYKLMGLDGDGDKRILMRVLALVVTGEAAFTIGGTPFLVKIRWSEVSQRPARGSSGDPYGDCWKAKLFPLGESSTTIGSSCGRPRLASYEHRRVQTRIPWACSSPR
jgi:hypothetical protein